MRLLIVLLISISSVSAQNYIKRYSDFLPNSFFLNKSVEEKYSKEIKEISKIHPKLILPYLKTLNPKCTDSDKESFNINLKYYRTKKEKWKRNILEYIYSNVRDPNVLDIANHFFNHNSNNIIKKSEKVRASPFPSIKYNNYIVLKFYDEKYDQDFDEEHNYAELINRIEAEKREQLFNFCFGSDVLENIRIIINNWYLFEETANGQPPNRLKISILKHFQKLKNSHRYLKNELGFSIGFSAFFNKFNTHHRYRIESTSLEMSANFKKYLTSANISFLYIYRINKYRNNAFSYIKFQLQYMHFFSSGEKKTYNSEIEYVKNYEDYQDKLEYTMQFIPSNMAGFNLALTLPVFISKRGFQVELGFLTGERVINYKIQNSYDFSQTKFWKRGIVNYKETTQEESKSVLNKYSQKSKFTVPLVSITHRFLSNLGIETQFTQNHIALNICYIF